MNKLTRLMNEEYKPKMAMIVYECSDNKVGVYLERRNIINGKMASGVPLTKKCIVNIMNAIAVDNDNFDFGIHGTIPNNLLYADTTPGRTKLVWYNPPQNRQVYFARTLGIPDGIMNVPGIIYIAQDNKLTVVAFKGSKPKGKLYKAPFMNVSDSGVCLGNSKIEMPSQSTFDNLILYWEKMFWMSEFSHILGDNPVNGNLAVITKHLIESGDKFPTDILKPSPMTLKSILR